MKSSPILPRVFSMAALAAFCVAGHKAAAQAPADENTIEIGDVQFGGLLDTRCQYDFSHPRFSTSLSDSGRLQDFSSDAYFDGDTDSRDCRVTQTYSAVFRF